MMRLPFLTPGALLAIAAGSVLAGCAVPNARRSIEEVAEAKVPAPASIAGSEGPLGFAESQELLVSIGGVPPDSGILQRHLAIEEAVAGSPLTADNEVLILPTGEAAFREIYAAIRDARESLNLEFYTIEDVLIDNGRDGGVLLSDLLLRKRQEGVAVNIIYDSYGSSGTSPDFFSRLAEAGVNLIAYHPISLASPTDLLNLNNRDHRKIVVADGRVAVTGGINLSSNYESKSPGSDDEEEAAEEGLALLPTPALPTVWSDTALRLRGPAVAELQKLFIEQWRAEGGAPIDDAVFFPDLAPAGNQVVRIIGSTPDEELPRYYVTLISSLQSAERRAWISAAYFVPTPEEKEELIAAAERGVDVRLLVAGSSDSQMAVEAARSHYDDLLDAGIKIYEATTVVLHSKTVVIDGVWSAIGSSNFDYRSVIHNAEVDAIVLGAETGAEMERIFVEGIATADEITAEEWEANRTLPDRLKGFMSRLGEGML